jgi:hypothetical protein
VPPPVVVLAKTKILVTDEVIVLRDGNSCRQWESLLIRFDVHLVRVYSEVRTQKTTALSIAREKKGYLEIA